MPTVSDTAALPAAAVEEICAGLTRGGQKTLPAWYLYDEVGSALFEAITVLPEYGLTRADLRLLHTLASELPELLPGCRTVVELGSGSGRKTRLVLESLLAGGPVRYAPIEISAAALDHCRRQLQDLAGLVFDGHARPYLDGLGQALRQRDGAALVLFLGSSIGNLAPGEVAPFLASIRGLLRPGDVLLLGTDLQQEPGRLHAAYDDPLGITAAFNLNLLARLHRDFGAEIDLASFRHEARVLAAPCRVEMHLRSRLAQRLLLPAAGLEIALAQDETIHTETCRKFHPDEVRRLAAQSGFRCRQQWIDRTWPFAETLLLAA